MGIYLNPNNDAFYNFVRTGNYVDKTMLIHEMNLLLNDLERNYVCVSRPRRFGKSLAENGPKISPRRPIKTPLQRPPKVKS